VNTYFARFDIKRGGKKEKNYTARLFESSAHKHHCGHIVREIQYNKRGKKEKKRKQKNAKQNTHTHKHTPTHTHAHTHAQTYTHTGICALCYH